MIEASCHCGNIKLFLNQLPDSLTSCNCSICNRLGALWGECAFESVEFTVKENMLGSYIWGDGYVEFHRCTQCGCTTHYTLTDKCEEKSMKVNYRMVEPKLIASIPVKKFDGADTWAFIEE